jgi:chromate transporter
MQSSAGPESTLEPPFASKTRAHPSFREAFRTWLYIGINSFGGPAGQIAVMHRVLVEEKRWISESRFLHALNYCMLLPGPEAQQLATYIGWLLHRTPGGLTAGILFVLPGFFAILALSIVYAKFQQTNAIQAIFFGLKAAVLAIVIHAVLRIGRRALKSAAMWAIAGVAFIGIFVLELPFPMIVIGALLSGFIGGRLWPAQFVVLKPHVAVENYTVIDATLSDQSAAHLRPSLLRSARVLFVCALLWFAPLFMLSVFAGKDNVFVKEGVFFSKAAMVTFGGAYAVLAYVAQQAVEVYGWLEPGEMLDGLGMAETTPGPLIMVVQFVGFMGAFRHANHVDPIVAGVLASVLVTWVTFVPCFLWIFLGAPYVESLRGNAALSSALSAITAAVVGVILNLAIWFGLHTLFTEIGEQRLYGIRLLIPKWNTIDWASLCITLLAMALLFRFRLGMIAVLFTCAALGAAWHSIAR